jgi:hypothetical protein
MRRLLPLVVVLLAVLAPASSAAPASRPFQTGFVDPSLFASADADLGLTRVAAAGATVVRLQLIWSDVAPKSPAAGFDATNPADPGYDFSVLDKEVQQAVAHNLTPLVYVQFAPSWAIKRIDGFLRADPVAFGAFAHAAAARYSGSFDGLPRVRFWQAWNEPNKVAGPSLKASQPVWYRALVLSFAASVHAVHADNVVVAGGLAPFGGHTVDAPMDFMRRLLCIKPACAETTPFEIWSTHPYTSGDPTHKAYRADDVSLGNLPEMHRLLLQAVAAGKVESRQPVRFWITEFSWDSKPPDPGGVPMGLLTRWVSEALYRMWSAGVTLCVWYRLADQPYPRGAYQSGFYYDARTVARQKAKPTLQAFRFPFVAFPAGGRVSVWGRTPDSAAHTVVVEQRGSGWRAVGTLHANANGIFTGVLRASGKGPLRATIGTDASRAFALTAPPDRFVNPFGR